MGWKEILGSALIGAAVSAVFSMVNQVFERRARQRELLLTTAVDLSKVYLSRIVGGAEALRAVPEVVVLGMMHKALKEVFTNGKVSTETKEGLDRAMRVV